jgi:TPR repeat protein
MGLLIALVTVAGCGDAPGDSARTSDPQTKVTIADGLVEDLARKAQPHTLYVVGNQYATGDGVEIDQDIAERLWQVACDKGHAFACANFGSRQIERANYDEAARALTRAAENGVTAAMANLVELHNNPHWAGASQEQSARWRDVLQAVENPQPVQSPIDEP